jgi:hypothetical protein
MLFELQPTTDDPCVQAGPLARHKRARSRNRCEDSEHQMSVFAFRDCLVVEAPQRPLRQSPDRDDEGSTHIGPAFMGPTSSYRATDGWTLSAKIMTPNQ